MAKSKAQERLDLGERLCMERAWDSAGHAIAARTDWTTGYHEGAAQAALAALLFYGPESVTETRPLESLLGARAFCDALAPLRAQSVETLTEACA